VKALVYVTLKPDVLDPQGEAIRKACRSLGYGAVRSVRQGKLFEIELDAADEAAARALLEELSDKLLANTVIEDHRVARVDDPGGRR
jgi:phosphoribosylformylglycinamidine synthase